jgi:hypothetical protein
MTPAAVQRASLEKDGGSDTGTIMDGISLDIKYDTPPLQVRRGVQR